MYKIRLSPYHKIFYNEWKIEPNNNYNIVFDQILASNLNVVRLKSALSKFVNDYVIFNSHVSASGDELYWIQNAVINKLDEFGIKNSNDESVLNYTKKLFDIENEPLYRFAVFQMQDKNYRLILVFHHLLIDGNSFDDLILEISNYYNDKNYKTKIDVANQISLINATTDELSTKVANNSAQDQKFWTNRLADIEKIDLRFIKKPTIPISQKAGKNQSLRFSFSFDIVHKVRLLHNKYNLSPYRFGQIIFAILLNKYTAQSRFILNYPVIIKEQGALMFGSSINTNMISYEIDSHTSVLNLIRDVIKFINNSKKHSYCPIYDIISNIPNKNLFDIAFIATNLKGKPFSFANVPVIKINHGLDGLHCKVLFEEEVRENCINYQVRYDGVLVDTNILDNFINKYKKLYLDILNDLAANTAFKLIHDYSIIDYSEYSQILYDMANNHKNYDLNKSIQQLFEEQVAKTPHNTAIIFENKKLSYQELNQKANRLAHYLKKFYKTKDDDLIALYLDRSEWIIIAILAVLKAGAAYVPIDPNYLEERIKYILHDTNAKAIIAHERYVTKLTNIVNKNDHITTKAKDIYAIDNNNLFAKLEKESVVNPKLHTNNKSLAYVIYTSGTTGIPNGVMIEHKSVINFIYGIKDRLSHKGRSQTANMLSTTNYVFDIFVLEYLLPLTSGAYVELFDINNPNNNIQLSNYDYIQLTPAKVVLLLGKVIPEDKNHLKKVKFLIGGEELTWQHINLITEFTLKNKHVQFEIINLYGPTEATIWSTMAKINDGNTMTIGTPLPNITAYILNDKLEPLPIGAIGELYLGGLGLARGYLNQESLTKAKFIINRLRSMKDEENHGNYKLYQTGDLCRYLASGDLEFFGRRDLQVKINGYRIELGEIETAISQYPEISECCVIPTNIDAGLKCLICYYTVKKNKENPINHLDNNVLLDYLKDKLPEYMLPSQFICLEQLPLTNTGKIDRKLLSTTNTINDTTHVAPRNDLEKKICAIYAKILNLDAEIVGINNNFFQFGGSSILAIRLANELAKNLNLKIPVTKILKYKTISSILEHMDDNSIKDIYIPRARLTSNQHYPLSFAEERLYFIEKYKNGTNAYNIPIVTTINQGINLDVLKKSILSVISRHKILHSLTKTDDSGNNYHVTCDQKQYIVINEYNATDKKSLINKINESVNKVFNLSLECPMTVSIVNKKATKTKQSNSKSDNKYLIIVVHHIAFDAWSMDILFNEIQEYYNYYLKLKEDKKIVLNLPDLSIQYKDFAIWQRSHLSDEILEMQLKYWTNKLSDYEVLNLPVDKTRPLHISYLGDNVSFIINEKIRNNIIALAKELDCSLFSVLLSSYYILLSSYTYQDDVVVGVPILNRQYQQLENLIGVFINNLVFRSKLDKDQRIVDYIKNLHEEMVEAQSYQDVPFEKLVAKLNPPQDLSRHPLFQVMFAFQDFGYKFGRKSQLFTPYAHNEYKVAKFDLTLFVENTPENLTFTFNYVTSLFEQETIYSIAKTYSHILEQISQLYKDSPAKINSLSYLTPDDYQKVVYDWNKTDKKYPENKAIQQMFEEQVVKTPNNIAIVYENIQLTYQELNQRANQLGYYLRKTYQIIGDDLIALCLYRSEYMIIAILAVLKSGAAYVPIDPSYPDERIRYVLEDTKAKCVLVDESSHAKLDKIAASLFPSTSKKYTNYLCILNDAKFRKKLEKYQITNLSSNITGKNLAYVIYTSGTTGRPKGVMIEHGSVINYLYNIKNIILNRLETIDFSSNVGVDFSITTILGSICWGNKLCIYSGGFDNLEKYKEHLLVNKITLIKLLPSYMALLMNVISDIKVNKIILGGEKVSESILDQLYKSDLIIYDEYGPTEATIGSSISCIYKGKKQSSNIGNPYNNYKAYILDNNLQPLPIGAVGELYLSGPGLARGYINKRELTTEKFIANPFQTEKEKKNNKNKMLYKTGDLTKYSLTGNLEFIGRNDSQIKINGYRVELKEIELCLVGHLGIKYAVVQTENLNNKRNGMGINGNNNDNRCLVGYYVAEKELNKETIVNYLSNKLPEYMIPNILVYLDKMPLGINGKINKNILSNSFQTFNNNYIAPRSDLETKICALYAEVLNLPNKQVGANDSFFELGGNSILAINLLYKLQKKFKINLNDIFELKTPAKIANAIPLTKETLYNRLKQIKLMYDRMSSYKANLDVKHKENSYLAEVKKTSFNRVEKYGYTVLLSGSTGHLGCHILYQLLFNTNHRIYLLVRAKSNIEGYNRVKDKFRFYFDIDLNNHKNRIITLSADLAKPNLDLKNKDYKELTNKVDSIIHSAALIKHYGDYDIFYQANVQATINLLEFAKFTKLKEFHYISTLSVLTTGYIPNYNYYIFTEDDSNTELKNTNNVYVKTKYEGELVAVRYRKHGVNTNIYRVGNLLMNSQNYRGQENIEENAFFTRVRTILNIGMVPREITKVEVSPVDCTASAIIKLFNQGKLENQTYHIANPNICDLSNLFVQDKNINIKIVKFEEFIDAMLTQFNNAINREQIEKFMLHQMWSELYDLTHVTKIAILQDKTNKLLKALKFSWPNIESNMLTNVINESTYGKKKMRKKEPIFEYLESIAELIPAPFYWLDASGRWLGLNNLSLKSTGAVKKEDVIGKNAYETYKDKFIGETLQKANDDVVKNGNVLQTEDEVVDVITGKTRYFSATRAPLRNSKGEIVGIVGTSIEITAEREAERLKLENERLAIENRIRHAEEKAERLKYEKEAEVRQAKMEAEVRQAKMEAEVRQAENEKLRLEKETEKLRVENEANKTALAEKEKFIAQKEAEQLKLDREAEQLKYEAESKEQKKFEKAVRQMGHDITAPLSSINNFLNKLGSSIPENERVLLRNASDSISGIAQKLISKYEQATSGSEVFLVLLVLVQMINQLREDYKNTGIEFEMKSDSDDAFACINHNPGLVKRMLANLIKNAVEALKDNESGKIKVEFVVIGKEVSISISDNGDGMPKHIIEKVKEGIEVSEGKKQGHGIGLTQVVDTIKAGNGSYDIYTNGGTTWNIYFPKIDTPKWIAMNIHVTRDDTVIILDDDKSVHGSWDSSFKKVLARCHSLKLKHFTQGQEVINYILGLTEEEKENIFLLTDYELLDQGINGLEVVEKTKIQRATLVTSYFSDNDKQDQVIKTGIKMLPKELVYAVKITIDMKLVKWSKQVDMVWVEDQEWLVKKLIKEHYQHLKIDTYDDPISFLDDVHQYPLDTRIILDTYYDPPPPAKPCMIDGFILADKLHDMGYTNLILYTGEMPTVEVPKYLKLVLKTNHEHAGILDKL